MKQASSSALSNIIIIIVIHNMATSMISMFVCESNVINVNFSFLCRFQEPSCLDVKVFVENQGQLTASICGTQERDEDDILCELNVTLPPRNDNDVQLSLPESLHVKMFCYCIS